MAKIIGSNLIASIVPLNEGDNYATHLSQYGKGGIHSVISIALRDAIPTSRLEVGMLAYVYDNNNPSVEGSYFILTSLTPKTWTAANIGTISVLHNDLTDLQGGSPEEYYHLTIDQHDIVSQLDEDSSGLTFRGLPIGSGGSGSSGSSGSSGTSGSSGISGTSGSSGTSGILPLDGTTENGVITYDGDGTGTVETSLTYDGNKLYFGENQESSIGFDGTDLNITLNDPSQNGLINITDSLVTFGTFRSGNGTIYEEVDTNIDDKLNWRGETGQLMSISDKTGVDLFTVIDDSENTVFKIKNDGNVGIGTISPSYKFSIASTDGTDQIGIYRDNNDAYMAWTDGGLILRTAEIDTDTQVQIKGQGAGRGSFYVYNQADDGYVYFQPYTSTGLLAGGGALTSLSIQNNGTIPVMVFANSEEGVTQEFKIYGYRTGDALRSLEIGVGVDANDTASFDGVSNYLFDGVIKNTSGVISKTNRITTTTTLDATYHIIFCNTDGGAFSVNLPAGIEGTHYKIINSGSSGNDATITPNGAETLFGDAASFDLLDAEIIDIHYNGTENWW